MGGGLLNLVSYGNLNIFITGNPKKSFFVATYKKYTNFGLQKHIITCNVTNRQLRENLSTRFEYTIPRWGDLLLDTFFVINMPYIWSPVWVEPSDRNITPGGCGTIRHPGCYKPDPSNILQNCDARENEPSSSPINSEFNTGIYKIQDLSNSQFAIPHKLGSAQIPYCQPYEFKWIENLGSQLIKNITVSIGSTIIQEFTGEYLTNLVQREYRKEKKDIFDRMTGNIVDMNNPGFSGLRKGLYPNCLYAAPGQYQDLSANVYWALHNNLDEIRNSKNPNIRSNLTPSIDRRLLTIPLNLWYMFSNSQSFPLVSMTQNALKITIECRPIRELFVVRDIRQFINNYYSHSFAKGNTTSTGTGVSIYTDLSKNYYNKFLQDCSQCPGPPTSCWDTNKNGQLYYSQFNIFRPYVPPPFISTIYTKDPLYQMYMFTTQQAATNQAFVQQAGLQTQLSADIASNFRSRGVWTANPRLCSTYVYLEEDEQRVFRSRPQSYLIKQIETILFEKVNHKVYVTDRFKSNNIVSNWTWFLQRSDVDLRNEWSNYSNCEYNNEQVYTLQPLYYTKLKETNTNSNFSLDFHLLPTQFANPNSNFSVKPHMFEITTANTLPSNFSLAAKYSVDSSYGLQGVICYSAGFSGLAPGSIYVGPGMIRNPPYFPFSWKYNDISGVIPYITGPYRGLDKTILKTWGLTLDGKLREENFESLYFNTVEQLLRNNGGWKEGLYSYNFSLNGSPYEIEPNGAMNLIHYRHIDFEYETFPLLEIKDPSRVAIIPICDSSGNSYGYNKTDWQIYDYTFNMKIFEEHYNVLTIENGLASLEFHSNR
jgi:hypothetical protein